MIAASAGTSIMGGSGPFLPVGASLMVDGNVQNDGSATRRVFAAPCPPTGDGGGERDEDGGHRRGRDGPIAHVAVQREQFAVLESYIDFYRLAWGRRIPPVGDGLAAALTAKPDWITASMTGPVNITHDGFATRAHVMRSWEGAPTA